jgi:hypothetical protein
MNEQMIEIPKQLIIDLVQLWDKKAHKKYGSPGHSHRVAGVWDGDKNRPCAECAIHDAVRRLISDI